MRHGTSEALEWPLIGRDDELARIAELRRSGTSPGVLIGAAAGIGKSSLARHAVAEAKADGRHTAWVQATRSAAAVPLGAFAALIPDDGVVADGTLAVMRRMAERLQEGAAGSSVVLGIDDAQLLDPTSAALVLHIVLTGAAFVVVTVRSGEPVPDAVQSLWKDVGVVRLELEPLGEPDTARLVETVLGAPVERAARRWMHESSRGNALYVRELLVGALAEGALEDRHGFWRLARRPLPSASLVDVISTRLAELGRDEARALELLALGEPLRPAELSSLVGIDALSGVEARGLIAVEAGAVRVAHPLYGEVVRGSMSVLRAHDARLKLARLVGERTDSEPGDALRVARWLLDAGQPVPAALGVEAAAAAVLAGDAELGARLAQLARDDGAGPAAALLLARAEAQRNRPEAAEAVLAAMEDGLADRDLALAHVELRAPMLFWALRRPADALAAVDRAAARWPEPAWRGRLEPLRLYLIFLAAGPHASLAETERALADPPQDPRARRRIEVVHGANLGFTGRGREGQALCRRLRPAAPLRDVHEEVALDVCAVVGLDAGEDLREHDAWLVQTLEAGVRTNDQTAAAIAAMHLAVIRRVAGRFTDAARWGDEAVAHFERRDTFGFLALALSVVADVARELGEADRAMAAAAGAAAALDEERAHDTERVWLLRGAASAQAAAGDLQAAQRTLLAAADRHADLPIYDAVLRYEALRAGAPARSLLAAMRSAHARCDARIVDAYVAHVEARAAGDATALLEAAEAFEAAGATRFACEAAAHAAEAFAAAGRQDSARRAAARCRELHEPTQGGTLPAMPGLDPAGSVLTAREAQLVELAARGLSNAEIAERLVLSVRTVESHLYRAMHKLGVTDRRDLRQV